MNQQCTNTGNICCLGGAPQCIFEQRFAQTDALMLNVHRKPWQDHHGDRVVRHAFNHPGGCLDRIDTAHCQTVKPKHGTRVATYIGLCAVGFLIDQCKALQKLIQCGLTTVEGFNSV